MDYNKLAIEEAQKSLCKKRKVGAIIVDAMSGEVISRGHNYFDYPNSLSGALESCEDGAGNTRPEVVHAEIAAISNLKRNENYIGYTIYVTHPPCNACMLAIRAKGLKVILVEQFMKFDSGKLRYSLVPPKATRELAKVLTYGAKKYKPNNWEKVDNNVRYIDALYRHLEAWRGGEAIDEESGLSHLSHAMTNIAFLIHFEDIKN